GGEAVGMGVVDIERERALEGLAHSRDLLGAAVALRVDRLRADEDEILEMVGEQPLHPEQGMNAAAAARAHYEYGGRRVVIERGRGLAFRTGGGAEDLVDLLQARLDPVVVAVNGDAQRDDYRRDHHRYPSALAELFDQGAREDASGDGEAERG